MSKHNPNDPLVPDGGRYGVFIGFRAECELVIDAQRLKERYPAMYNSVCDIYRKATADGLARMCAEAQIPSAVSVLQAAWQAEDNEATGQAAERLIVATFQHASAALAHGAPQKARQIVDRVRGKILSIKDLEIRDEVLAEFDKRVNTLALPAIPPPKIKIRGLSLKPSDAVRDEPVT